MKDWRDSIDDVDELLLEGYQSVFPVTPRPFGEISSDIGVTEREAVDRVRSLIEDGLVRRLGPVLNPPVIGSSALGALRASPDRINRTAEAVNQEKAVNHNYERDHRFNLWFVVTASTPERRSRVFERIGRRTGTKPLRLPMEKEYYVDLAFPVVNDDRWARENETETDAEPRRITDEPTDLSPPEARVVVAVQDGLPISTTPYADVANYLGMSREKVIETLHGLREKNCVKRIGLVVNHHRVGFDANCMVVWRVPADETDTYGSVAGRRPYVTYCCHRKERPERDWKYTLFTMVHGRDPEAVNRRIDDLADEIPYENERLETVKVHKQTGVRYTDLVGATTAPPDQG